MYLTTLSRSPPLQIVWMWWVINDLLFPVVHPGHLRHAGSRSLRGSGLALQRALQGLRVHLATLHLYLHPHTQQAWRSCVQTKFNSPYELLTSVIDSQARNMGEDENIDEVWRKKSMWSWTSTQFGARSLFHLIRDREEPRRFAHSVLLWWALFHRRGPRVVWDFSVKIFVETKKKKL